MAVLLLFGRGKIASVMGEFGKGITSFKKGMKDPQDQSESISPKDSTGELCQVGSNFLYLFL